MATIVARIHLSLTVWLACGRSFTASRRCTGPPRVLSDKTASPRSLGSFRWCHKVPSASDLFLFLEEDEAWQRGRSGPPQFEVSASSRGLVGASATKALVISRGTFVGYVF